MATVNYSWTLPTVGGSEDTWGTTLNTLWTDLDTLLGGTNATEFAILDGATVSTAELNLLDGVTATTAEINYVDGVTSNIQTQIDGKQASDATLTALAGTLTAANKVPYATGLDTAGELDFKDEDAMTSDSATAVASQQSIKAYVDTEVAAYAIGVGQTWQDVSGSRAVSTSYQNTTGRPIMVSIGDHDGSTGAIQVSSDDATWIKVGESGSYGRAAMIIIPDNWYYRCLAAGTADFWAELR